MKKFFKDFKKFIMRGNVLDMAVGVIVGGAFSKIVTSMVNDILMPLIAFAAGGNSVSDLKWVMREAEIDSTGKVIRAEAALHYGNFIQVTIDFLLIATTLFLIMKLVMYISSKLRRNPDGFTLKEYALLRKSGMKRKEVRAMEEEKIAKAIEERKNAPKKETDIDVLKDIRSLLKENVNNKGETQSN